MKIILTGATGFIGSEILRHCLRSPSITSVVVLSRRNLPEAVTSNPRVKVIIMNDFTVYPDTILKELGGAEACIWALGRPRSTHLVEVEYPIAAVSAFTGPLSPPLPDGQRFRFVYLSGMLSERDLGKKLWFAEELRKLKVGRRFESHSGYDGETENGMIDLGSKRSNRLQTFICRPGLVLSRQNLLPSTLVGLSGSIRVDELAAAMMKTAMEGAKTQTLDNPDLRTVGRAVLKANGE